MRPGLLVWVLPLLLLAAAAAYVRHHAEHLPERIPTHHGFQGPDRWGPKNVRTLYGPLAVGALVLVNLSTIGIALARSPRRSPALIANTRLLLALTYAIALMFAVFGSAPARDLQRTRIPGWVPLGIFFGALIAFGWPVLQTHGETESESLSTPEHAWRGGVVYYNRADPNLVVPKRFGIGYTLNMAHKFAWIVVGQLVVLIGVSIWLMRG